MDHLKRLTGLAAAAVLLLSMAGPSLGQAGRGTARLGGVVVDPQGKPLPGVKVTAAFDQPGGAKFETTTDKKGEWSFLGLGTGTWRLAAEAPGYLPAATSAFVRQLERNPRITIKLEKAAGSGSLQDPASAKTLEEAQAFFREGRYEAAQAMYEDFLAQNPAAYQVLLSIGDCQREKGDLAGAMKTYERLIASAEADQAGGRAMMAKGLAAVGLCHVRLGDLGAALERFKRSVETSPGDERLLYSIAEILFSNHQVDEAIRYYDLAIEAKPDWPDPYLRAAYASLNKGDNARAIERLERFIELEPATERTSQAKAVLETIKKPPERS